MPVRESRDSNTSELMRDAAKAKVEPHLKHIIKELIDLYRYSKIAQKRTITKAINDLSDKNTKRQNKSIQKYEKMLEEKRSYHR
jgi:hypothetical protein